MVSFSVCNNLKCFVFLLKFLSKYIYTYKHKYQHEFVCAYVCKFTNLWLDIHMYAYVCLHLIINLHNIIIILFMVTLKKWRFVWSWLLKLVFYSRYIISVYYINLCKIDGKYSLCLENTFGLFLNNITHFYICLSFFFKLLKKM